MNFYGSISMKRSYERSLSAGLIHMSPMHLGYEDFLMQQDNFQGPKNGELIQKWASGTPRVDLPRLVREP